MKIDINYGDSFVPLQIPEANITCIIRPWQGEKRTDNSAILQRALAGPDIEDFRNAVAGRRLCVLLDDGTRSELQVKEGDRVLFSSYAGETFKLGDRELLLMREEDVLAVIE